MWAGVDIENLRKSIYGNFYTPEDYSIIDGRDDVSLAEVKRVINKSKKIGDSVRPGVKFCVSDFRQSQEWRWKAGRILV